MEHVQSTKYDRVSYLSIAIMMVLIWGFYRTYIVFFPSFEGFQFVQHFHGAIMLLWVLCLIAQPLLISRKKYRVHRTIGKISFIFAPLLVVSIFLVSRMAYYNRVAASVPEQDAIAEIALNIPGIVVFAALYSLAIANRKRTFYHMRYMIGTAVLMIGPGLGRALILYFGIAPSVAISITLGSVALIGISLLVVDLVRKNYYLPNLIVALLLTFEAVVWELRYSTGWQLVGKTFATIFY